jgi:ABC-type transport system involved in multi-copper enzyme maturation permease subunit
MGATSKIVSFFLRIVELASAAIVAGLVGQYLHYLTMANSWASSRIIYTEVIAGISILFSILFMPPLKYSFYGFVVDFALFICWMVAFGSLADASRHIT